MVDLVRLKYRIADADIWIKSHTRMHLDELLALWLIVGFATPEFVKKFCQNGELELGVGGGSFDEHPTSSQERKQGQCCADLVAEALGVAGNSSVKPILGYVRAHDLEGQGQPWDLADVLSAMYFCNPAPENQEKIADWIFAALEAKCHDQWRPKDFTLHWIAIIMDRLGVKEATREWLLEGWQTKCRQQQHFFTVTAHDYQKNHEAETVAGPRGSITMVSIISDDELIAKYARFANSADVVLVFRSTGHCQIIGNKRAPLDEAIKMIRVALQLTKGHPVSTDWRELTAEGTTLGAEEVYFFPKAPAIFNGSLTNPDVPPVGLAFAYLKQIVRAALNSNEFEPNRATRCRSGTCSSQPGNVCPWHQLRLRRCWEIQDEKQRM